MGSGKPRKPLEPARFPDPKTGQLVTQEEYDAAEARVARHAAAGFGREIVGDEFRASEAASNFARAIEEEFPFPFVSDDEPAERYVARFWQWRGRMEAIEEDLRRKGISARRAVGSMRDLVASMSDLDAHLFPEMKQKAERARAEADVYEMFANHALQRVCRKGGGEANKSDQGIEAAICQLYWKGVPKARIAKLLRKDRRDVRRVLEGADEITDVMRAHLGLTRPPGELPDE